MMRSEGSGRECLLADYLELGKIKRHTHIQSALLPSFLFLFHTHIEGIGLLEGVIPRMLFGEKEKLSQEEEGRDEREREGDKRARGGERVSFYIPIIKSILVKKKRQISKG